MDVIKSMVAEHDHIKSFLAVLGNINQKIEDGHSKVNIAHLRDAVEFLYEYAGRLHHAKEEKIIFEFFAEHSLPDPDDHIHNLETEHFLGRAFASSMDEAVDLFSTDKQEALEQWLDCSGALTALLVHHICKEDMVFYPFVEKSLDPELAEEIERRHAALSCQNWHVENSERLLGILERLKSIYGLSEQVVSVCSTMS